MVCDLRVSPETAPPSFEKGILRLTHHCRWFVRAPFLSGEGVFVFLVPDSNIIMLNIKRQTRRNPSAPGSRMQQQPNIQYYFTEEERCRDN